jgi:hypothetical protein
MMRWTGYVAFMGEMGNAYKFLVGKPERKKRLLRSRRRWMDNTDLGETGRGVDWIHLVQDRDQWRAVVGTIMNLRVP